MIDRPTILLIDDDASHLKLHSIILGRAGYNALPVMVRKQNVEIPENELVSLTLLDYRLGSGLSAPDVARRLKEVFPSKPILVLSELQWIPDDIAGLVDGFSRKGEPDQLLAKIRTLLST